MTIASMERQPHEYTFTQADFETVVRLIYRRAGISLSAHKQDMVYSRLARRLRERGLSRFDDYLALLRSPDSDEWEGFTNALTTNLTSFFREAHHFPVLAAHLKAVWARRREPLSIWCCAASTGEEPYTIAMTAIDAFGTTDAPVRIVATDLDTQVLAKAADGIYDLDRAATLPPGMLSRHFLRGTGSRDGTMKVRPAVRKLVTFAPLNLLDDAWPRHGPFDAIFCRNVMIYFDRPTQQRVLQRLAPTMRPDGLLFAGHSENFSFASDLFTLRGKTVYERANPAGVSHG